MYHNSIMVPHILNICDYKYDYFFTKANVVGVGLGHKIKNGLWMPQHSITVLVSKKVPEIELSYEDKIPSVYNGALTDVIESGAFKEYSLNTRIRPVIGGYSICNELDTQSSGSMGCLVTDGDSNYILGCNHTLALKNTAPIDSKIIQQAISDGGNVNNDAIALLSRVVPLKFITPTQTPENFVDCAVAELINPTLAIPSIAYVGIPKGTSIPRLHEDVKKVGQITHLTRGIIVLLGSTVKITYRGGLQAILKKQIITTNMAEAGDSGAVLLNNNNYALGLLCGGTQSYSCFSLIDLVLNLLSVYLVTK